MMVLKKAGTSHTFPGFLGCPPLRGLRVLPSTRSRFKNARRSVMSLRRVARSSGGVLQSQFLQAPQVSWHCDRRIFGGLVLEAHVPTEAVIRKHREDAVPVA